MSAVLQTPAARLAHSRARLRLSLSETPSVAGDQPRSAPHWLDELKANPGIGLAKRVLEYWWSRHPLRVGATLTARAATAAVGPIARRHPWGLMVGAVVVGGAVAWIRPWRWSKAALWTGLLPQLLLASVRAAPTPIDRPPTP